MPTTLLLAHPDLKTQWHLCNQTNINFLKKKVTFNHSYKKKATMTPDMLEYPCILPSVLQLLGY